MHTKSATEDSGVDLPELLARVEYDREFLREIFEVFREEFPVLSVTLNDAAARKDCELIRIAAHTMTGMLATLCRAVNC
jgi:HPt (histidine-containing phosphotransfer) domain-containing protein